MLARYHFLHSLDGRSFASMMLECHANFAYPSEYALFLVQCLLQLLYLRNADTARQFFAVYTSWHAHHRHPKSTKQVSATTSSTSTSISASASATRSKAVVDYGQPLVNFCAFLLETLRGRDVKCYHCLLKLYKPHLSVDPSLDDVSCTTKTTETIKTPTL